MPRVAVPFSDAGLPFSLTKTKNAGLDIAEARIDLFQSTKPKNVAAALEHFKGIPTVATIRTKNEGGGWKGSEVARQDLFKSIIPLVDAVDIELSSADTLKKIGPLARKQGKLLIVSYHNFETTPKLSALKKIIRNAEARGADIVKIATQVDEAHPEHMESLINLLMQRMRKNLIVIGMGSEGVITRLMFPRLGSLITFASDGNAATAPGQVPYKQMSEMLRLIYPAYC